MLTIGTGGRGYKVVKQYTSAELEYTATTQHCWRYRYHSHAQI